MPKISSPTRHVLGEKDKNASFRTTYERDQGTIKSVLSGDSRQENVPGSTKNLSGVTSTTPAVQTSRKRTIIEVEEAEVQGRRGGPEVPADSKSYDDRNDIQSSIQSSGLPRSGVETGMTPLCATQESQPSLDEHFQLPQEEVSQRTLEKIHAVPMPHNASQPPHLTGISLLPPVASQDSVGMSTFINFSGSDGSQRSDGLEMIEERGRGSDDTVRPADESQVIESSQPGESISEEHERRLKLDEAAARLRTRLQLAYFKVQTNQTAKPLSRLQLPQSNRRALSPTIISTPIAKDPSSALAAQEAMEARVSAFRAQATAQMRPTSKMLNTLPFPSIQPTAFSARFADDASPRDFARVPQTHASVVQIPSSPPISHTSTEALSFGRSNSQEGDELDLPRPSAAEAPTANTASNNQLSSPPESHNGDARSQDEDRTPRQSDTRLKDQPKTGNTDPRLTSSMVKDEAADGLLRLRRSS